MPREEAIKMVTINPAIQLKVDERVGSIKVGKDADFTIWNGDPLSTYTKCEQTWIEGRNYFSWERDRAERERVAEERNALIQKVLRSDSPGRENGSRRGYEEEEKQYDCEDNFDVWRLLK
jgi:adenine deaminase